MTKSSTNVPNKHLQVCKVQPREWQTSGSVRKQARKSSPDSRRKIEGLPNEQGPSSECVESSQGNDKLQDLFVNRPEKVHQTLRGKLKFFLTEFVLQLHIVNVKEIELPWCYEGILLGLSSDNSIQPNCCFSRPTTTNQIWNRSTLLTIGNDTLNSGLRYQKSLAQVSKRQLRICNVGVDNPLLQIIWQPWLRRHCRSDVWMNWRLIRWKLSIL